MRGCILPLALIATSVDAFAPALMGGLAVRALPLPAARVSRMGLRMQEDAEKKPSGENAELSAISAVLDKAAEAKEAKQAPAGRPAASQKEEAPAKPNNFASMALKVGALRQTSPLILSQMAGNKGFDPLGFAKTPDLLLQYREAELKHARLAMLASVGWVMSELYHTPLAQLLGQDIVLQEDAAGYLTKAPSVLNGGMLSVPVFFWVVTFLFSGVFESWRMLSNSEKPNSFTPGALGFDPLGFYDQEGVKGRFVLETKEVNNGRLAMIAIAVFAGTEYMSNTAIVEQTPWLFTEGPLSNVGNLGGLLEQYSGLLSCKSGLVYCSDGQDAMGAIMSNDASNAEYINEVMTE